MPTGSSVINPYEIILYALLHDIGKIFVRFAYRYNNNIEKIGGKKLEELNNLLKNVLGQYYEGIEQLRETKHDKLSKIFIDCLLGEALDKRAEDLVNSILEVCDPATAAERGIETNYKFIVDNFNTIKDHINNKFREKNIGEIYDHYTCPYLLPTWVLIKTDYVKSVGPQADSTKGVGYDPDKALRELAKVISPILDSIEKKDIGKAACEISDLLAKLANNEVWVPVLPITYDNIIGKIAAYDYERAYEKSSYYEVLYELLILIYSLKVLFGGRIVPRRCIVDTLSEVLRLTTLFVPAAVWGAIVPDTSLYAHSKYTAAIASVLVLSPDTGRLEYRRMRLLAIDLNGIQRFIAAPVKSAAASRVLRGRSLLVELIIDSLTRYVLELFGGLPHVNVITSEGGSITILIPDVDDISERMSTLKKVCFELSKELSFALGSTIAISRPFSARELEYFKALQTHYCDHDDSYDNKALQGLQGFLGIIRELEMELSKEKSRRLLIEELIERESKVISEGEIEGRLDSITREVIHKHQKYKLDLSSKKELKEGTCKVLEEYVELISGGKLSEDDIVSHVTHLSLVAGTCGRNLAAVISTYVFEESKINDKTVIVPAKDIIYDIVRELGRSLGVPETEVEVLAVKYKPHKGVARSVIGIIPISSLGTVHILISIVKQEALNPAKNIEHNRLLWGLISIVLSELTKVLISHKMNYEASGKKLRVYIDLKTVNTLTWFMPRLDILDNENINRFKKLLEELLNNDIELSFRCLLTNTYHPTRGKGEVPQLVDLDEYNFIALSKMDCDSMGSVKLVLSFSPSRLISLSEVMNLAVACKSYMLVLEELSKRPGSEEKPSVNVIVLYAGGDDIALYGEWKDVIYFVNEIYNSVRRLIGPITLSLALTIDKPDVPILDLYRNVVRLLEEYAKKVKSAGCICYPTPLLLKRGSKYAYVEVLPLEPPGKYYNWPDDDIVRIWNLRTIAELIKQFLFHSSYASRLEDYKRELYMLSSLGHLIQECINSKRGDIEKTGELKATLEIVELYMRYAYLWARREENLKKLVDELKLIIDCKASPLLVYPDDIVSRGTSGFEDAIRMLAAAKLALDLILLAFRERGLT